MHIIFITYIFFLLTGCASQENPCYTDIDFNTFTGVNEVKKYGSDAFLEIISNDEKEIVIDVYTKAPLPLLPLEWRKDKGFLVTREVFEKRENFYYNFEEYTESDPAIKVKVYSYFKNEEILVFKLLADNGKPYSCIVKRIDLVKNEVQEVQLGKWVDLSPIVNIEELKNDSKTYSFAKSQIIRDRNFIIKNTDFTFKKQNMKSDSVRYKGFPGKYLNIYWNLYKGYLGHEVH